MKYFVDKDGEGKIRWSVSVEELLELVGEEHLEEINQILLDNKYKEGTYEIKIDKKDRK